MMHSDCFFFIRCMVTLFNPCREPPPAYLIGIKLCRNCSIIRGHRTRFKQKVKKAKPTNQHHENSATVKKKNCPDSKYTQVISIINNKH